MRHPAGIHIPLIYSAQTKLSEEHYVPSNYCSLKLPCAQEILFYKHPFFSIVLQNYDAMDVFLCVAEIRAQQAFYLHLQTVLPDIYWIFNLKGTYQLHPYGIPEQHIIQLEAQQYTIAYAPPQQFTASFPPGIHRYIYFSVSKACLQRNENHGPALFKQVLQKQAQAAAVHHIFPAFPIRRTFSNIYGDLLGIPKPTMVDFAFEAHLSHCIASLIRQSKIDLSGYSGENLSSHQLATKVRQRIQDNLKNGVASNVNDLADYFNRSRQNLNQVHRQHYRTDLQSYIKQLRMEKAMQLLQEERLKPSDVWIKVGYQDIFAFSKAFKKYYGVSPSTLTRD